MRAPDASGQKLSVELRAALVTREATDGTVPI